MNTTRIAHLAAVGLAAGVLVACSSSAGTQGTPVASSGATTTTESSAVTTTATTTTTTTETTPPPPELPNEGRDLGSCADGQCRVDVVAGDQLPLPEAAGGSASILSIADGSVTVQMPSGTLITIGSGSTLTFGGYVITLPAVAADGAVLQLNGVS